MAYVLSHTVPAMPDILRWVALRCSNINKMYRFFEAYSCRQGMQLFTAYKLVTVQRTFMRFHDRTAAVITPIYEWMC